VKSRAFLFAAPASTVLAMPQESEATKKALDVLENGPGETAAARLENATALMRPSDKGPAFEWERGCAHVRAQTQAFFADYAAQTRKPHFGPIHREVLTEMLKRATEAGLFTPTKE
jgi:hypothetical protein